MPVANEAQGSHAIHYHQLFAISHAPTRCTERVNDYRLLIVISTFQENFLSNTYM